MLLSSGKPLAFGKDDNHKVLRVTENHAGPGNKMVIEKFVSYGQRVGASTFDACEWGGRFIQAWYSEAFREVCYLTRNEVKKHVCGTCKSKDKDVRKALIKRFEPGLGKKKRPKGILKGVSKDMWSALALAVTFYDRQQGK